MSAARPTPVDLNAQYLSVGDYARILGVSERTVWRWIRDGDVNSINVGGVRRVVVGGLQDADDGEGE